MGHDFQPKPDQRFDMAGTEETHAYTVVVATSRGRVGYRQFATGCFRVRLEPANTRQTDRMRSKVPAGWKHPDASGGNRFSTVIWSEAGESEQDTADRLFQALSAAIRLVVTPWVRKVAANATLPEDVRALVPAGSPLRRFTEVTALAAVEEEIESEELVEA